MPKVKSNLTNLLDVINNLQEISETKEHHGDEISKIPSVGKETLYDKWSYFFKKYEVTKGNGRETYI